MQQLVLPEPIAPKIADAGIESAIGNHQPLWVFDWLGPLRMVQLANHEKEPVPVVYQRIGRRRVRRSAILRANEEYIKEREQHGRANEWRREEHRQIGVLDGHEDRRFFCG
jgi:hypothetical protein